MRLPAESPVSVTPAVDDKPHTDSIRGKCPQCGGDLVSGMYHVPGKGYILVWECVGSMTQYTNPPTCNYRRVL